MLTIILVVLAVCVLFYCATRIPAPFSWMVYAVLIIVCLFVILGALGAPVGWSPVRLR